MIDNFDIIGRHLIFESDFDRYIVHILKRAKDESGKKYGVNTTNRLIKTFYITSKEYLERKIPVIKDMCESYGARAYILPQVRDNSACLRELLKITVDNLENPTIKPDHLVRSAFCGFHSSRAKRWIMDLDDDNMTEYSVLGDFQRKIEYDPERVLKMVRGFVRETKGEEDEVYMIPTPHGNAIVTPPFDLQKAYKKCSMFFQGVQKREVGLKWTGPDEREVVRKDITGWVIKDGMALLYHPENT